MVRFENIVFLYALALIPLLFLIFWILRIRKIKKLKSIGDYKLVKLMIPEFSISKVWTKIILFLFGLTFLILCMANLQTGSKMVEVKREGADIMICLDVSNSMLAEDLKPNRLQQAKFALEKLLDKLEGDRIGLIVFAGDAYVQLPITTDYGAAKMFISGIHPGMIPTQGTNISAALQKAFESFGKEEGKNKAIILISDGEDHEQNAITLAEELQKNGVSVHSIGIGSAGGVPIPVYRNGVAAGYKKDKDGNTVITKLNQDLLRSIAGAANGIYVQASQSDLGLNAVLSQLRELDKKQFESKMYANYEDQFQWFAGLALLFLIIEILFNERVSKWWQKIKPV